MEKDISPLVIKGDLSLPRLKNTFPVIVVLDRLRSAFNVGNIFRVAEALRLERLITCGYTATPPHPKLTKTARGCDSLIPASHYDTTVEALRQLKHEGYTIYGIETVEGAECVWGTTFQFPAAFVLGNEALGISEEVLGLCDQFISLPTFGQKNSINVGNCAAVVLYSAIQQLRQLKPATTSG